MCQHIEIVDVFIKEGIVLKKVMTIKKLQFQSNKKNILHLIVAIRSALFMIYMYTLVYTGNLKVFAQIAENKALTPLTVI